MKRQLTLTRQLGNKRQTSNWVNPDPGLGMIFALGLGAGLMYLLDPDRGRRRRALVRDQLAHLVRKTSDGMDATARDLSHRVYGILAEGSHLLRHEEVSDE